MKQITIAISILLFANHFASCQNDCASLLQYGVYNHINQSSNISSYAYMRSKIMEAYNEYKEDKKNGTVKAKYGAFGGSGGFSSTEIESLGTLMSSSKIDETSASTILQNAVSYISPEMVQAYRDCIALKTKDELELNISLNASDNDQRIVTFELVPNIGRSSAATLQGINVIPANSFVCKGSLWDAAKKKEAIKTVLSMTCERAISNTPINIGTKKVLAPPSAIQISTTSRGITTHFSPILPPKPEIPKNIGEIVASMLSAEDFLKLNGADTWMLADGSRVPNGCAYQRITNRDTVPNLCGQFLRGKQNSRKDGGNPDGDLLLGTVSLDKTSRPDIGFVFEVTNNDHTHSHPFRVGQNSGTNVGQNVMAWDLKGNRTNVENVNGNVLGQTIAGHNIKIVDGGDAETRPVNVTVNFFIRIN